MIPAILAAAGRIAGGAATAGKSMIASVGKRVADSKAFRSVSARAVDAYESMSGRFAKAVSETGVSAASIMDLVRGSRDNAEKPAGPSPTIPGGETEADQDKKQDAEKQSLFSFDGSTKLFAESVRSMGGMVNNTLAPAIRSINPVAWQLYDAAINLKDTIVGRAKEIGMYDPRMAISNAMRDVNKRLADIQEARALGKQYSDFVDSATKAETGLQRALQGPKAMVMEKADNVANVVNVAMPAVQVAGDMMYWTNYYLTAQYLSDAVKYLAKITGIMESNSEREATKKLWDDLFYPNDLEFQTEGEPADVQPGRIGMRITDL